MKNSEKTGWLAGHVTCGYCGHRWVAVRPAETPTEMLECPACGQQGYTFVFELDAPIPESELPADVAHVENIVIDHKEG